MKKLYTHHSIYLLFAVCWLSYFSAYLGRYGDERALPELCRYFREEQLDYATYQELKNAIERLGGEAEGPERDFSRDPYYLAVHGGHEGHSCS